MRNTFFAVIGVLILLFGCTNSPRLYKDQLVTYTENFESSHNSIEPPIMFVGKMNINNKLMFTDCKNDDTILDLLVWENVPIENNLFHYYNYAAIAGKHYDQNIETDQYVKIKRISVSGPLISDQYYKQDRVASLFGDSGLEGKLLKEIKKCNGDAFIDVCLYYKNFIKLDTIKTSKAIYKKYRSDLMLSATIIKFKNNFYPDQKLLIKKAEK